jgi:hypothetical protein
LLIYRSKIEKLDGYVDAEPLRIAVLPLVSKWIRRSGISVVTATVGVKYRSGCGQNDVVRRVKE